MTKRFYVDKDDRYFRIVIFFLKFSIHRKIADEINRMFVLFLWFEIGGLW